MVKLRRVDENYDLVVDESFQGDQGKLWKSGKVGTATLFSSWVSSVMRANSDINNSALKTRREYVTQDGNYETLNISYGRKDMLPLDIRVGVPMEGKSKINLKYRKDPKVARWVEKDYIINDPMALSVDPTTKKLMSVVFSGSQFSFASNKKRDLSSIPGYTEALREITIPIVEASKILDAYDESAYKSRDFKDFDALPEVQELKDLYRDWEQSVDTSKLASQNKVTYIFNHPTNPDYNFTVYFRDEGGSDYRVYATYQDREMNLARLAQLLNQEVKRLAQQDDEYSRYESREIKKEMTIIGKTKFPPLEDEDALDFYIKQIGTALDDSSLNRLARIDITQNSDGSEDWELQLSSQHTKPPKGEKGLDYRVINWRISEDGKILNFNTDFGYDSDLNESNNKVDYGSSIFFNEITKAAEKFLEEYGAYNRNKAGFTTIDNQIIGGKDWIQSYDNPDYDLANWMDRTLATIEPELDRLQREYNLDLTRNSNEVEQSDSYTDLLAKYGIVKGNTQDHTDRDRSGFSTFTGSYIDKNFMDHLLELRINFDRGDRFVVWVRPDLKGSDATKAKGQSDLSFFTKWVEDNVSRRSTRKDSDTYKQSIIQELKQLGAMDSTIRDTLDIVTSKIKGLTIDLKVTNNKVFVNAYRDGKIVSKLEYDIAPFGELPVKVAKKILKDLSKSVKESFPSVDRTAMIQESYWDYIFNKVNIPKHKDYNSNIVVVGKKKCKVSFDTTGTVTLSTLTGKQIKEEQFCVDLRYIEEDSKHLKTFLEENSNRM